VSGGGCWRTVVGGALAAAGALSAACAPAAPGAEPPQAAILYVADERAGTLNRLDGAGGRPLEPPLPVGAAPAQVVVGAGGGALVRAGGPARAEVTYVAPLGDRLVARPVTLEPGARAVLLAGDGGDYAAVAYARPARDEPACGLVLVDLRTGRAEAPHLACTPRELVAGVALERSSEGPIVYLALWRRAAPPDRTFAPAGARLLRLTARSGAPLAEAPLDGLPRPAAYGGSLLFASSPLGGGRLYAVEALPGSQLATWDEAEFTWQYPLSAGWRLRRLSPQTLEPEVEMRLPFAPTGLAVAPDGAAYAFDALGDRLVTVDLGTGRAAELARVPGHRPWGLAATASWLYAAGPPDGRVWVLDRSTGRRVAALRAGRAPVAIGVAPVSGGRAGGRRGR
jgi:hypothetical protein